jgi:dihydrofolate reductase
MGKPEIRVSVFIAASLDGFIARSDGDVSWLDEYAPLGEDDDAGYSELFNSIEAMIMGRGTFEKVLTFEWPYGAKPITVLSSTLSHVPEKHKDSVRIASSTPSEVLEKMAAEGYQHIYLDGGQVIQSFLREGLVDDLTLTIIPVLLGEGIPLFGHLEKDIKLDLLKTRSWENGFVQTKYQVVV